MKGVKVDDVVSMCAPAVRMKVRVSLARLGRAYRALAGLIKISGSRRLSTI